MFCATSGDVTALLPKFEPCCCRSRLQCIWQAVFSSSHVFRLLCACCVTVDAAGVWWLLESWEEVLFRDGRDCRCIALPRPWKWFCPAWVLPSTLSATTSCCDVRWKFVQFHYCFSDDSKDHEFDLPVTLLPSAAELLFGSFRDPGSWQLLSDRTLRCSAFCGILEFAPVGSFASSPGNGKRDSAKDESLLLVILVKLFAYPQVEMAAVRQLRSCITAGTSAAAQVVEAAAALDVYFPLSFDWNNASRRQFLCCSMVFLLVSSGCLLWPSA